MAYGSGEGNTVTHHYAGTIDKPKKAKTAIKIKKANKGKFTSYCKSKGHSGVTNECIDEGLASKSSAVNKRAQFALNSKSFKH